LEKVQIQDFPFVVIPVVLVATEHNGKVNFAPHGQYGTITAEPPVIYISVIKEHLTARNILQTKQFSVNIPGKAALDALLHCGNVSGNEADKSKAFKTFYGNLKIPMIEECRINYTCQTVREIEIHDCYMFLGAIKETYIDKSCLDGAAPDIPAIDPLLASIGGKFWTIEQVIKTYP
jgi:flavin reductase (DIM6/NTAB) family NADH-FMN oxidoreductase RutF